MPLKKYFITLSQPPSMTYETYNIILFFIFLLLNYCELYYNTIYCSNLLYSIYGRIPLAFSVNNFLDCILTILFFFYFSFLLSVLFFCA